jgi:hypothetical protein
MVFKEERARLFPISQLKQGKANSNWTDITSSTIQVEAVSDLALYT